MKVWGITLGINNFWYHLNSLSLQRVNFLRGCFTDESELRDKRLSAERKILPLHSIFKRGKRGNRKIDSRILEDAVFAHPRQGQEQRIIYIDFFGEPISRIAFWVLSIWHLGSNSIANNDKRKKKNSWVMHELLYILVYIFNILNSTMLTLFISLFEKIK